MLFPGDDEDAVEANYEAAIELISETDWSNPQKSVVDATKVTLYGFFGQEPKAPVKKAEEAEKK